MAAEHVTAILKLVAGCLFVTGAFGALGIGVTTYWLLGQTRQLAALGLFVEGRRVSAAAVRGEWPDLSGAIWHRRCWRVFLTSWLGGFVSIVLHEIWRA
jgi:hypothetical protein